eukprot:842361-Prymnesium_polylepis.1
MPRRMVRAMLGGGVPESSEGLLSRFLSHLRAAPALLLPRSVRMADAFESVSVFHNPIADPRVTVRGVAVPANQVFDGTIATCACVKDATHCLLLCSVCTPVSARFGSRRSAHDVLSAAIGAWTCSRCWSSRMFQSQGLRLRTTAQVVYSRRGDGHARPALLYKGRGLPASRHVLGGARPVGHVEWWCFGPER